MASRDFLKHVVSTSEPVGSALGDQWYNPTTNTLSHRLAVNGTSVAWVQTYSPTVAATLQNFTESISIAAPNATVPVSAFRSTNSIYANLDFAVIPKGNGAIIAAVPDGGAGGGDKRGTYAVDLQLSRSAANEVASGAQSVIAGGDGNRASDTHASVGGGFQNRATGSRATIPGGLQNTASGTASFAVGYFNTSNADHTVVMGRSGTSRGIHGYHVFAAHSAPIAQVPVGIHQAALLILGRETVDATPRYLTSDSTGQSGQNQVVLPNNSAYYIKGSIIATVTGGGNTKSWDFVATIKRGADASTTSIVGTVILNVQAASAGASTWTVAITADTVGGCLAILVTGQAATTIRWVCKAETTEVTF
jgi:hypothetical protein